MIGIGFNNKVLAEEAGLPIPSYPVVFTKYAVTLVPPTAHYHEPWSRHIDVHLVQTPWPGHTKTIAVDAVAKELDYEGELTVVIGKDVNSPKPEDDPLGYVHGFTVGSDVSSRFWRWP
ncbi:hypothetical protein FOPE_12614 [Fonsecaea pedrosoi]|nr:hypothetical protein FOPE_12614 [Fonsecaea pedrosoi]